MKQIIHRYKFIKALRLWKEKPIIGIGLEFLWEQKRFIINTLIITIMDYNRDGVNWFILFFCAFIYYFNILWKNSKFNESIIPTSCILFLLFF